MTHAAAMALVLGAGGCAYHLPALDARVHTLPTRLSEAGLYADASMTTPSAELLAYTPSFELWSDAASKRRWIRLPPGTAIDATNVDDWSFPVGTELWKEFSVAGRRIETRLLRRVSADAEGWVGAAYVWNDDQTDALLSIEGEADALGTEHDVPEARACMTCHGGRASVVLGFSAIQLAHAAVPGEVALDELVRAQLVSPPPAPITIAGTPDEIAAVGYLHANCASCHNGARPPAHDAYRPPDALDLWLTVASTSDLSTSPTYRTSLGHFVQPGRPDDSAIVQRLRGRVFMGRQMPPIASEQRDETGLALVTRWVSALH
ncbi:MAG: hypothetical protein U0234_23860 [Sandaracinus sp.]